MIYVVGLGPGNSKYIVPAAIEVIESAEMVIGAERNLEAIESSCKKSLALSVGFPRIADYLKEHKETRIAVVVSGDTGFHSMLAFVKRHVEEAYIEVVPGISSLQYMYSRIKKSYEQSQWISLHGRQTDLDQYIESKTPLGILTDKEQNNQRIAASLKAKGIESATVYVGERLSYDDERISVLTIDEAMVYKADPLSVVVIEYD